MSFPRGQHLACVFCSSGLEGDRLKLLRERTLEACRSFPLIFSARTFSLADFALYPSTVINLTHKCSYMLIPVSPFNESPNLEAIIPDTLPNIFIC